MMFTIGLSMSWFSDLSSNPAPSGKDSCLLPRNVCPGRTISVNWSVCSKFKITSKRSWLWQHRSWETSHNWRFIKGKKIGSPKFSLKESTVHTNFVPCKFGTLFKGSFITRLLFLLKKSFNFRSCHKTSRKTAMLFVHPFSKRKAYWGKRVTETCIVACWFCGY